MKTTLKSVAVALTILAVVVILLTVADGGLTKQTASTKTFLKVTVVDLNGAPVHNAQVTVLGNTFNTDNKGLSPAMELDNPTNCYDENITEWRTVTVVVQKDGFAPAVVFNCVVYSGQTRKLTVKLYNADGSELPYVTYVESPPDDYVKQLLSNK